MKSVEGAAGSVCENCSYSVEEARDPPGQEGSAQGEIPGQAQPADPSGDEADFQKQRAHFVTELRGDARRCPHPSRFREWSMENPSQDIGWNVSERRTFRCRVCGKVVTERV